MFDSTISSMLNTPYADRNKDSVNIVRVEMLFDGCNNNINKPRTLRFKEEDHRTLDEDFDVIRHGDLRHSFVGSEFGLSPAWELFCVLIKKDGVRKSEVWPHIVWGPDVYGSGDKRRKGYFFRADVEVVFGSELALKKGGFDSKSNLSDLHLSCLEETVYLRPSFVLKDEMCWSDLNVEQQFFAWGREPASRRFQHSKQLHVQHDYKFQ